jgi:excisionase family DNA binding protein
METVRDVSPLLLKIPEVAAALRVGRSTVYELIAKGELKVVHIGRAVRVPASEVETWVERQMDEMA